MENSNTYIANKKLIFLRTQWGFNKRGKLTKDPHWLDVVGYGSGLSRDDNLGKYERGERNLNQDHIEQICKAFTIPIELMQDYTPFEVFEEKVKSIRKSQIKNGNSIGFIQIDSHATLHIITNMKKYSVLWENSGYSYDIIENYGKDLKLYTTTHQKIWDNEHLNKIELAFILMISVHFNAGWEKWVPLNIQNEVALTSLFIGLHVNYLRTRFRILYSLQFFDFCDVKKELQRDKNRKLSKKTKNVIKNFVSSKQIVQFLRSVASSSPENIGTCAENILFRSNML